MKLTTLAAVATFALAASACSGGQNAGTAALPAAPSMGAPQTGAQQMVADLTAFQEFKVPTGSSQPFDITLGADGNYWITEQQGNKIARMTPSGSFTEFRAPDAASMPAGIVAGKDGNVWFTENQYGTLSASR